MVFKPGTGFASSNYMADTKKLNPFRVHFMRPFYPHVGSLRSPTWGFQEHNSYRVANMENDNIYYKNKTFKRTTHTELSFHIATVTLLHGHYDETIGEGFITRYSINRMLS